jgi:hypothetical protein
VDFDVGCTFGTRPRDVVARYLLAVLLNFSGDGEKSAQLVGDRRRLMVVADSIDQIIVAVEMVGGGGASVPSVSSLDDAYLPCGGQELNRDRGSVERTGPPRQIDAFGLLTRAAVDDSSQVVPVRDQLHRFE